MTVFHVKPGGTCRNGDLDDWTWLRTFRPSPVHSVSHPPPSTPLLSSDSGGQPNQSAAAPSPELTATLTHKRVGIDTY